MNTILKSWFSIHSSSDKNLEFSNMSAAFAYTHFLQAHFTFHTSIKFVHSLLFSLWQILLAHFTLSTCTLHTFNLYTSSLLFVLINLCVSTRALVSSEGGAVLKVAVSTLLRLGYQVRFNLKFQNIKLWSLTI